MLDMSLAHDNILAEAESVLKQVGLSYTSEQTQDECTMHKQISDMFGLTKFTPSQVLFRLKAVRCGHYGDPPDTKIFLRQLLDWQAF